MTSHKLQLAATEVCPRNHPKPDFIKVFSTGNEGWWATNFGMFARGPSSCLVKHSLVFDRVARSSALKLIDGSLRFLPKVCLPMLLRAASSFEIVSAFLLFGNFGACGNSWQDWFRRLLKCCCPIDTSFLSCLPGPTSSGLS